MARDGPGAECAETRCGSATSAAPTPAIASTPNRAIATIPSSSAPERRASLTRSGCQVIWTGVPSGITRAIQRMFASSTLMQPCERDDPSGSARLAPSRPWIATRPGPPP